MAEFVRNNGWNKNGTFDNEDLLWYAMGVREMQARSLDDASSWWFFAAIHGQYVSGLKTFPGWAYIPAPPQVPVAPVPPKSITDLYWDQCQHQSWFFPPWHRGYLIALEAQIRAAVVKLGGPKTWALPYWNYLGQGDQYKIPPAFTQQTLPDGSANPLFLSARYGPKKDGDVYIPEPPVSGKCQQNTIYSGSNSSTPAPGYGGPKTGFSNSGQNSGNLENNPHNLVHNYVGGYVNDTDYGLMADPGTAALDPIFYLHHCNIDRMWASWNAGGNYNPTDQNWLKGPAVAGERPFIMPMPGGQSWVYTPADVNSLDQLDYQYDSLEAPTAPLVSRKTRRLRKLRVQSEGKVMEDANLNTGANPELVGANGGAIQLKSSGARTAVKFERGAWKKVPLSLARATESRMPDHVYLQLENVQGTMDANILSVSVNHKHVGEVSLFGLRKASMKESHHGGSGLTFLLDISDVVDELYLDNSLDVDSLDVTILPGNAITGEQHITIGRVTIYREAQL